MSDSAHALSRIREAALSMGFDAFGVAAIEGLQETRDGAHLGAWIDAGKHGEMDYLPRGAASRLDPGLVLPGAQSMISVAMNYWYGETANPSGTAPMGVVARYARGRDYHKVFTTRLKKLEDTIHVELPGAATRRYVDTGPVLEKLWAQKSGLGWRGKHTNLVSRRFGSWLFLGEILVDQPLPADVPEEDFCGTCTRCIDACPTRAITGPYALDARLCISYLTIEHRGPLPLELRPLMGTRIFGCDDCLEVCPWNRFAEISREADFKPRPETLAPLLLELLEMDEEDFYRRFAGTPLTRAKRNGLVRNVCVALGNLGRETQLPQVRDAIAAALNHALQDSSDIVREHAAWALQQW